LKNYVIETTSEKGRSFSSTLVAAIVANSVYEDASSGQGARPVWAMWAGAENSIRPFMANLRLGRKAQPSNNGRRADNRIEFLKTARFQVSWQREAEGVLSTIYHPELFRLDPGMVDPSGIKFLIVSPADWEDSQNIDTRSAVKYVRTHAPAVEKYEREDRLAIIERLAKVAYLFAVYLDRRTRMPLFADGSFYLQLLCAALDQGLASLPGSSNIAYPSSYRGDSWCRKFPGFATEGTEDVGIRNVIAFQASHEAFETFLVEQVQLFRSRQKKSVPMLQKGAA
jgi:hypothetical protein